MEEKMMELTYERINGEYLSWALENGENRDKNDLRFGQYLYTKYDMSQFKTDVFYFEDYERVYSEILKELYEQADK